MDYNDKAEQLNHYMEENHQDILRSLRNGDWLQIYASSIKDYSMNMDNVLRVSLSANRKQPEDYGSELQSLFGGNSKPSWSSIADYASFLSSLYESGEQAL